jgi:serine protease Do
MRRFVAYGPALVVLLTAAAALFAVPTIIERINTAQTSARIQLARLQIQEDDILDRINRAVRNVAVSVEPSVVHIDAGRRDRASRRFGVSSGAGWVYDDLGHIVTNAHVVGDARRIDVQFADGRKVSAEILGTDDYTDIAVLRLSTTSGLFPIARATHEQPRVGDRVFAFGSPFGFKFSMSEGIVSGLGRNPTSALGATGFANFIQTDAAVNPGNSGGPLVDVQGRLVGMNVAIATGAQSDGSTDGTGQSAGISFAIPLATIESVASQLIESGTVARGFFGINYNSSAVIEVAEDDVTSVGVPVSTVVEDGPAGLAGMREFDVITHVNNQRITDTAILRSVIAPLRPGQHMRVRVWRTDDPAIKEQVFDVRRYIRQGLIGQEAQRPSPLQGYFETLDITLGEFPRVELASQLVMRYGIIAFSPETAPSETYIRSSAQSRRVLPGTGAYEDGFRAGQEVLSVEGKPVHSAREFYQLLADEGFLDSQAVRVTVRDDENGEHTLTIELSR